MGRRTGNGGGVGAEMAGSWRLRSHAVGPSPFLRAPPPAPGAEVSGTFDEAIRGHRALVTGARQSGSTPFPVRECEKGHCRPVDSVRDRVSTLNAARPKLRPMGSRGGRGQLANSAGRTCADPGAIALGAGEFDGK